MMDDFSKKSSRGGVFFAIICLIGSILIYAIDGFEDMREPSFKTASGGASH
jgi:hypothetical protein